MPVNMPIAAFQYDVNGRLNAMTMDDQNGNGPQPFASASYTSIGQLYQLSYGGWTETRTYNTLGQLINQTVPGGINMTYNYSSTQNNGRITGSVDANSGENTTYTYDALNRLTRATNSLWTGSYSYDGFGNMTQKVETGQATMNATYNANNQQSGVGYDANGNYGGTYPYGWTYSVENRMTWQANYETGAANLYAYDPWGKRVMSGSDPSPYLSPQPNYTYSFYGITGQRLATLNCNGSSNYPNYPTCTITGQNVYFGRKLIVSGGVDVVTDRLGSVRSNGQGEYFSYFPYGNERTSTADGLDKFGTYFRDTVGQDYADQRYYGATAGRFWSPDPGGIKTADGGNPTSWNRYAYVQGDPVNHTDRHGLFLDAEDCINNPDACLAEDGDCEGYGAGFNLFGDPTPPDPSCPTGGGEDPGPPAHPDCGQALGASGALPSSATGLALVAVLMGEDSWSLIGTQQYVPGNTLGHPGGLVITQSTVALEESLMLGVIANQATAHHLSILAQATASGFALGYQSGLTNLGKAETSAVGSSLCNHLTLASISVDTFTSGGSVASAPYNQWRAIVQTNPKTGRPFLVSQQPGYYVVGGTIFFTIRNP
jgi:RHS repeat-associated protein